MDVGRLKTLYEELGTEFQAVQEKRDEAKQDACNARDYASTAEDYVADARSAADTADDRLIEMQEILDRLQERLQDLDSIIAEAAAEEGSGDPEGSLSYQVAKHKKRVLHHLKQGAAPKAIAKHLGISETLVEMIKRADERERTTA